MRAFGSDRAVDGGNQEDCAQPSPPDLAVHDLAMSADAQGTGGGDAATPADAGGQNSHDAASDVLAIPHCDEGAQVTHVDRASLCKPLIALVVASVGCSGGASPGLYRDGDAEPTDAAHVNPDLSAYEVGSSADLPRTGEADAPAASDGSPGGAADGPFDGAVTDTGCPSECQPGRCQAIALASGLVGLRGLAIGSESVYFTENGTNTVTRIAKTGGTPVVIASSQAANDMPWGVAVDSTHVYWVAFTRGFIARTGHAGQDLTLLVPDGEYRATDMVVDDVSIYWIRPSQIRKVSRNGGVPVTLVEEQSLRGLAIDRGSIYWSSRAPSASGGRIMKMGSAGENPTPLVTGVTNPDGIAVHGSHVYYTEVGRIRRVPVDGGQAITVAMAQTSGAIAVDAAGVYWANGTEGTVMTAGLDGGGSRVLASGQKMPTRLALDACHIYWLDIGAGTVMKVSR